MICMIEGCEIENQMRLCVKHWGMLSDIRKAQWFRESNEGQFEPTVELVYLVNKELKPKEAPNLGVAVVAPFVETPKPLYVVWS